MSSETAIEIIRRHVDPAILTRGRVVLIGLGGIGLPLCRELVTVFGGFAQTFAPGESIIFWLADGDSFELANTYRMDVPGLGNKAEVVGRDVLARSSVPGLHVRWQPEHVRSENIGELIQDGDCALLAVDNHSTRRLVGRHCAESGFRDVILISGGNDGVEEGLRGTYGNVQVYVRKDGVELTAPLDRFHPEIAEPADHHPDELSCLQAAAQGSPQLPFVNYAVAVAMCNALLRLMMPVPGERMYDEASLDVLDAVVAPLWVSGPQESGG
jgi:molybdopterin/thiamine biosynthesis adenylyltransferase